MSLDDVDADDVSRCLADIDVDGNLAADEFCVAMYLIDMAKMGQPLPTTLPPGLVPPSMRRLRRPSEPMSTTQLLCNHLYLICYTACGAVYCNRSRLWVCVCVFVGLLPR